MELSKEEIQLCYSALIESKINFYKNVHNARASQIPLDEEGVRQRGQEYDELLDRFLKVCQSWEDTDTTEKDEAYERHQAWYAGITS